MTLVRAPSERHASTLALVAIVAALAVKPWSLAGLPVLLMAGAVALLVDRSSWRPRLGVLSAAVIVVLGVAVFALGREFGPPVGVRLSAWGVVAILVAAIVEEAVFRGALWTAVDRRLGPLAALVLTSALFALIHVPTYGWVVLPIDLAAGAIFGWQRLASGGWLVPAMTHLFANLLQMG